MLVYVEGTDCPIGSMTSTAAYKRCMLNRVGLRNSHRVQNVTHFYVVKSIRLVYFEKTNRQLSAISSLN